jgi:hypothetical protein
LGSILAVLAVVNNLIQNLLAGTGITVIPPQQATCAYIFSAISHIHLILLVQSISKLNIIFASVKQRGIGAACMAN